MPFVKGKIKDKVGKEKGKPEVPATFGAAKKNIGKSTGKPALPPWLNKK